MLNKKEIQALYFMMLYWGLFGLGLFIGSFLPIAIVKVFSIAMLVVIVLSFFKSFPFEKFSYFFATGLGITAFYFFSYKIKILGAGTFISIAILAIVMFLTAGIVGIFIVKDVSSWGNFLFIALLALVVMSVFSLFLPMGSLFVKIISIVALLLFLAYTIYDFNRMKRNDFEPQELGFNLFLNLLNIFQHLLNLAGIGD